MGKTPISSVGDGLRIPSVQRGRQIVITVNGEQVIAYEGESVHAALAASGVRQLRDTGQGESRGVFCGMGICYECLVTVNSLPNQRACMTQVEEGMEIVACEK
ncbi:(2Fe-2S)-binding protein [Desulfogranum marinum]|uniref:(2Fe-2S)-binding protein n=1 Tax=Desulfogranum marinum TaxID=453220 RepID=UPI0029C7D768|nr:(2Fe-2S)-binding protein [Desulfogranum marinum]